MSRDPRCGILLEPIALDPVAAGQRFARELDDPLDQRTVRWRSADAPRA